VPGPGFIGGVPLFKEGKPIFGGGNGCDQSLNDCAAFDNWFGDFVCRALLTVTGMEGTDNSDVCTDNPTCIGLYSPCSVTRRENDDESISEDDGCISNSTDDESSETECQCSPFVKEGGCELFNVTAYAVGSLRGETSSVANDPCRYGILRCICELGEGFTEDNCGWMISPWIQFHCVYDEDEEAFGILVRAGHPQCHQSLSSSPSWGLSARWEKFMPFPVSLDDLLMGTVPPIVPQNEFLICQATTDLEYELILRGDPRCNECLLPTNTGPCFGKSPSIQVFITHAPEPEDCDDDIACGDDAEKYWRRIRVIGSCAEGGSLTLETASPYCSKTELAENDWEMIVPLCNDECSTHATALIIAKLDCGDGCTPEVPIQVTTEEPGACCACNFSVGVTFETAFGCFNSVPCPDVYFVCTRYICFHYTANQLGEEDCGRQFHLRFRTSDGGLPTDTGCHATQPGEWHNIASGDCALLTWVDTLWIEVEYQIYSTDGACEGPIHRVRVS
jgi:hypothetical protein